MRIVVLTPPFYSHFLPLIAPAAALRDSGAEVIVGCSRAFEADVAERGLRFVEITINRNANTGQAPPTSQAESEQRRLREFLEATRRGPIETLRTQNRHRVADMLANPNELLDRTAELNAELNPDLWIVDQLSYGVTLALVAHGLRFVTFCPPHPLSIPPADVVYSVPPRWPAAFTVSGGECTLLENEARTLEHDFTRRYNELLAPYNRTVDSAFRLASPELVIHNYPELPRKPELPPSRVYCGYSFVPPDHDASAWDEADSVAPLPAPATTAPHQQAPSRIIIALGTFLSARSDTLIALAAALRRLYPEAIIAVGAGEHVAPVRAAVGEPAIVEPFIAQQKLLRKAELFVHHGGVSSFTEALYYEVPMIVMPFSSDQFNVAADIERTGMGAVLDPNRITLRRVGAAADTALTPETRAVLKHYSTQVRARGPAYAAAAVLRLLS